MIRTLGFSALFASCALFVGCDQAGPPLSGNEPAAIDRLSLIQVVVKIQINEQSTTSKIEVPENITVLEVIQLLDKPKFTVKGSGAMAFVDAIDGKQTSSGEGWVYYINGAWAKEGIGTQRVRADDEIEWKYGAFEPE